MSKQVVTRLVQIILQVCCVCAEKMKSDLMFTQDPKVMNFFNERVGAASCRHINKDTSCYFDFFIPPFVNSPAHGNE